MVKGWDLAQSHADFSVFFSLLDYDYRKRLIPIVTTTDGSSALDLTNARKWSFHSNFWRTIQNAFLSLGITIAVRKVTPAVLWKKKGNFKKILEVVVGARKKMPGDRAEFQKEVQDIIETKSPSARLFGAKSYKSAGKQEKLFEVNITLERKEIKILQKRGETRKTLRSEHNSGKKRDNFELRMNIIPWEPRPNIPEWPSHPPPPSHTHNLSFTHDGYIRHAATEMIILMTDISVIWHSTG